MEDVLEVYKLPYDELRPVVCMDETNRQLIGEVNQPIPMAAGQPRIYDYEYVRNGVADIFMMFEPLAARRYTKVTDTRTKIDFAHCLWDLRDEMAYQVKAWNCTRNSANLSVDWQFATDDARIKLKHLYPKF